jgi:hypothetical protein
MAYNNYFPAGYQPVYYPQIQNQAQAPVSAQSSIIWVQGEAGAKSYMVAPNQTVQLWDSESQTIYLKSADASGMPSIRVLDYTIRDNVQRPAVNEAQNDFATKDDISALEREISSLKKRFDRMNAGKENHDA